MRTIQEKWEKVQDFRPIDDVFFEALAQSKEVYFAFLCWVCTK